MLETNGIRTCTAPFEFSGGPNGSCSGAHDGGYDNNQNGNCDGSYDNGFNDICNNNPDSGHDELAHFLEQVQHEESYVVQKVLKEQPHEITQIVRRISGEGASNSADKNVIENRHENATYIRKYIALSSGLGQAYETLFAALQSDIHFEHVPYIYECYKTESNLVVVMEYISGETLEAYGQRVGFGQALAQEVFPLICTAVSELHEKLATPLIHRDIKPTNIILAAHKDSLQASLLDFGIARSYKPGSANDTQHFSTRGFAPPEQFGFGQTSVKSDVYALGIVLFYCVLGRVPTAAELEGELYGADIPKSLRKVITKAAAFSPTERYESASELATAFEQATQDEQHEKGELPFGGKDAGQQYAFKHMSNAKQLPNTWGNAKSKVHPLHSQFMGLRNRITRIPSWVGTVWNTCLLGVWVIFAYFCASMVADIPVDNTNLPLWYYLFEYPIYILGGVTAWLYFVADRRWLRRKVPRLGAIALWKEFVVLIVVGIGMTVLFAYLGMYVVADPDWL